MEDNKPNNIGQRAIPGPITNPEENLSKKERAKLRRLETIRSNNILLALNLVGRGLGL